MGALVGRILLVWGCGGGQIAPDRLRLRWMRWCVGVGWCLGVCQLLGGRAPPPKGEIIVSCHWPALERALPRCGWDITNDRFSSRVQLGMILTFQPASTLTRGSGGSPNGLVEWMVAVSSGPGVGHGVDSPTTGLGSNCERRWR